ncbi:MAG TPA: hypothetical protein PLK06_00980 [bacterium]|nr:hypothetical protein [bacterium]
MNAFDQLNHFLNTQQAMFAAGLDQELIDFIVADPNGQGADVLRAAKQRMKDIKDSKSSADQPKNS